MGEITDAISQTRFAGYISSVTLHETYKYLINIVVVIVMTSSENTENPPSSANSQHSGLSNDKSCGVKLEEHKQSLTKR